jgi:signal transduction histidine kinase
VWRAGLLIVVYVALLILAAPLVVLLHQRVITPSGISSGLLALEAISVGAVLSLGPFLYAYFVRQSSFFHEYTLAGLTHELKSPLAAIESALEIINEQKKLKPGSAKEKEFLEMIERNSTRLQRFTSDLIHVFGDKKNLGSLEMAELNDLCQKGVDSFLSQANSKNTQIEFFPLQSNPSVSCDAAKVEQVISNLVSNAVKFTDGGKIFVKLKEEPAHFLVEVGDTGKGIPPEELPYVFDRFFQGEAGRRAKGTGIGLAIAKTWVEAHGGKIYAESEGEGKGSLFHFTLPKRN